MRRRLAAAIAVLVVAAAGLVLVGLCFGNPVLLLPRMPPRSGMDRFLVIVWPLGCMGEVLLAALNARGVPRASIVGGILRLVLAAVLGWALLWGSVYLRGELPWVELATWSVASAVVWQLIPREKAQPVVATMLVLALLILGVMIVLGGWLKGGLTALPMALSLGLLAWRVTDLRLRGVVLGCGAAGLMGLAALGHFFGRVSILQAGVLAAGLVAISSVVTRPPRVCRSEPLQS